MGGRIGSITFGGLSSGLNTDQLIQGLLALERGPIDQLTAQRDQASSRADVFRDLNARTLSLRSLLRGLDNRNLTGSDASSAEEFTRYTATSSDSTIATASVAGTASAGTLTVRVDQLALASRLVSEDEYSALTDTVGTGTFTITDASGAHDITIDSSNDTVEGFVAAINDSGADVSAFIVNDGVDPSYRIAIQGNRTGADNSISLSPDPFNSLNFLETQAAQDALVILDPGVNPISVKSSTNTVSDIVEGVTLQLSASDNTADLQIQITADDDATVGAIQEVVDAYNSIMELINQQADLDPTTGRGGPLIGDGTLASLQRQLSTVLATQIGSGSC